MQIAIIAGGLATRLGDLTKDKPKSMVDIQGKPFMEYQIDVIRRGGIENIILCLGHGGDQIEKYFEDGHKFGVNIRYSFEDKQLGTAGALKNASQILDNEFFTIYGDSYLFLNFKTIESYFRSHNKLALMTVYKNYNKYDKSNTTIEGNIVKKYSKDNKTNEMEYIDYGANLFRREVLEMIPENQFYPLEALFPRLISMEELLAFEVKKRFYEIGSIQGLKEFTSYIKGQK